VDKQTVTLQQYHRNTAVINCDRKTCAGLLKAQEMGLFHTTDINVEATLQGHMKQLPY